MKVMLPRYFKEEAVNTDIFSYTGYSIKGYNRVSLAVNAYNSALFVTLLVSNSNKLNLLNNAKELPVELIRVDCLFIMDSPIV